MNSLDFFSDLVSDMTGAPREEIRFRLSELEKYVRNDKFVDSDISPENMKKILEAVKTDPQSFLDWVTDGEIDDCKRILPN